MQPCSPDWVSPDWPPGRASTPCGPLRRCTADFPRSASGSRLLALTYDDGPNDPYTWRMMEVLERHGVKATFFLIGRFVQQKPEIARALVAAGHAIGSHTWDHPNLIFASAAEVRRQLQQTQQAILDATGVEVKLFRPPFGGRRPASLRAARALGLQPVMWNVTCQDWKAKSAGEIVARAERQIRGGNVILLHDGGIPSHRRRPQPQRRSQRPILARYQPKDTSSSPSRRCWRGKAVVQTKF